MVSDLASTIRIARSVGRGSGVFLAKSLLDALDATRGHAVVRVLCKNEALTQVEFVLSHVHDDHDEVIRAVVDHRGRVVSAEILRAVTPLVEPRGQPLKILKLLRNGHGVSELRLLGAIPGERARLALTMTSGASAVIEVSDSDTVLSAFHG